MSTNDAISMVTDTASQAIQGSRWREGFKQYCLMATLHVKNAFNTARWDKILNELDNFRVPGYLQGIIRRFFQGRELQYFASDGLKTHEVSAGVPQGSVPNLVRLFKTIPNTKPVSLIKIS